MHFIFQNFVENFSILRPDDIIVFLLACTYLLSYDTKCLDLIAEDILLKPVIYRSELKVLLESFYRLNYFPSKNFNDLFSFFGSEVTRKNSLDGINHLILILVMADHKNECDLLQILLDDFHKICKVLEKREKGKKHIANKSNLFLVLKYFQDKYPLNKEISNFVQANKEFLDKKFSNTMKISLNVKKYYLKLIFLFLDF